MTVSSSGQVNLASQLTVGSTDGGGGSGSVLVSTGGSVVSNGDTFIGSGGDAGGHSFISLSGASSSFSVNGYFQAGSTAQADVISITGGTFSINSPTVD